MTADRAGLVLHTHLVLRVESLGKVDNINLHLCTSFHQLASLVDEHLGGVPVPAAEPGIGLEEGRGVVPLHNMYCYSCSGGIFEYYTPNFNGATVIVFTNSGEWPKQINLNLVESRGNGESVLVNLAQLYLEQLSLEPPTGNAGLS